MFARFVTLLPLATLAAVVAAAPSALEARTGPVCNSGSINCCNSKFDQVQYFSGTLGGLLSGIIGNVNVQCNSISLLDILGGGCTQQTACCKDVEQNGLVNVACSPVSL